MINYKQGIKLVYFIKLVPIKCAHFNTFYFTFGGAGPGYHVWESFCPYCT